MSSCSVCKVNQNNYEKHLMSWPKTANISQRIYVDFFYKNNTPYLIIVDSKSKWIDIHSMTKGLAVTQIIEKLKSTLAIMGLPQMLVSDNGPPFNSSDFVKSLLLLVK